MAEGFRFRLQRLQRVAEARERWRAELLAAARAREEAARAQAQRAAGRESARLAAIRQSKAALDPGTWLADRVAFAQSRGAARQAAGALEQTGAALGASRAAYLDARRASEVLARLRQRRWRQWRAGQQAAEQRALDEVAVRPWRARWSGQGWGP